MGDSHHLRRVICFGITRWSCSLAGLLLVLSMMLLLVLVLLVVLLVLMLLVVLLVMLLLVLLVPRPELPGFPASSRLARGKYARERDVHPTAIDFLVVEGLRRTLGVFGVGERHEPETARLAGLPVHHDPHCAEGEER